MRLAVVGSRSFNDYKLLSKQLSRWRRRLTMIVTGGASGADLLAMRWARKNGVELRVFLPDWKRYGRSAGPRRNRLIVAGADRVLAFWDGTSPGTLSTINIAKRTGRRIDIIKY
jgi:predicted Rossmann fold nucleotide-binding protein DprA/Smf involved in DNA uptake